MAQDRALNPRMRALMITKWVPLPDNDGSKQRALAITRRLAERCELVLCAYRDNDADVSGLESIGVDVRSVPWRSSRWRIARGAARTGSVSAGRFYSPELAQEVRQAAGEAPLDLLQVESLHMAPLTRGLPAARRVLDLHNIESALMASYANTRRGAGRALVHLEAASLGIIERRVMDHFDTIVVVSEQEAGRLQSQTSDLVVCPNARDPGPPPLPPAATPTAAFVAALGWAPNADAAAWFGLEVWPDVVRRLPSAQLLLVGRDPTPAVRALSSASVEVTGTVEDVSPYLARARIAVAPLRSGGGSRLKILEALASGRPVVATSSAIDGFEDLVGRGVVVANTPSEMSDAVVELLGDPVGAFQLGLAGHRAVSSDHTWDSALAPLFTSLAL